jgi:hypothetical protein
MFSVPDSCLRTIAKVLSWWAVALLSVSVAMGENATLRGTITDQTGARVPGATVTLKDASGNSQTTASNQDGIYSFSQLAPGAYSLQASAKGMDTAEPISVILKPTLQTVDLMLHVQAEKQNVEVEEQSGSNISAENANNATSITLRGNDLQSLGDSQEDLSQDLQALAGPSAGPGGGQLFVDGFSGGTLPSKESIREIKINQNPFSPEYDKLGYGRIEV